MDVTVASSREGTSYYEPVIQEHNLIAELVTWFDSELVQAAFGLARIHGQYVSKEFSDNADRIWGEAKKIALKEKG